MREPRGNAASQGTLRSGEFIRLNPGIFVLIGYNLMMSKHQKKTKKEKNQDRVMGVQQILLAPTADTKAILDYLCQQSGKIYNCGVYYARQIFFKTGKLLTGNFDLAFEPTVAKTQLAQSMPSSPMQQTLISVCEAFKSYQKLRSLFFKGGLENQPKPPGYLKGDKLFKVVYPNSGGLKPKVTDGMIRFSLGTTVKRWFNIGEFFLPMPTNIDISKVKEFTILPKNGAFYLEISYEIEKESHILDINQALSIDLGTSSNLAACVDTQANSFLVDAREMKAMNQLWNKRVATRKEGKEHAYWDSWLDRVTRKRNHQMRDGVNKAAKLIVDHCIEKGIGTIVVGWNEGFKINAGMRPVNNQKFVQMPLGKLKDRLEQLCERHGIRFLVTEESYTSLGSYLDGDSLPVYGKKPDGWKASGSRTKRGLYRCADKSLVNADLNGSANILTKVAGNLGIDLGRLGRRTLTTVARLPLWQLVSTTQA